MTMRYTDQPQVGFYRMRLVRGGPWVPARIWLGKPRDPETGEEMDRSLRLMAEVNGQPADLDETWIYGRPITEAEYRRLTPHPEPRTRLDIRKSRPIF